MNGQRPAMRGFCLLCFLFFAFTSVFAEGTKQLSPVSPGDTSEVMLHTNASGFGNFATFGANDTSSLFVRITDTTGPTRDTLYIGLSREAMDNGDLEATGQYQFRIVRPDGSVAFGPIVINVTNSNADTWLEASSGPDVLDPINGYSTNTTNHPYAVFVPDTIGDYRMEFLETGASGIVNIKWFDFTVVNGGAEQPGRLWSRNWALRTPPEGLGNTPPECQFNQDFNGVLYSYTMDGFVSRIDFDSSGFQGLSFTVAFGLKGPGTSGNIIADRMSVNNMNATSGAADHMVFVNEPDTLEFPSAVDPCGTADVISVACIADSFCINIGVDRPGQVELIFDFFGNNGIYDPNTTDVLLAMVFDVVDTTCLFWDGLMGNGQPVPFGTPISTFLRYSQGVQHYAAFDVELLKFGFCVETVRPICPGASTDRLFWDDSNITDDLVTGSIDESESGTMQPAVQLNGCVCRTDSCRTWTNFQIGDPPSGTCQGNAIGYGEMSTLNTWWFANTLLIGPIVLPVVQVEIVGDSTVCEGDSTQFMAMGTPDTIAYDYAWTGPNGFMAATQSSGFVSDPGQYYVTITDPSSNCFAIDSITLIPLTNPTTSIVQECPMSNQVNANVNLTVSGSAPPFMFTWSNGAMTEDLMGVAPGEYSVIVVDTNGCMAFDTIQVVACCTLDFICPSPNGGLFSCPADIPVPDTTIITVTDFCDPLLISSSETDNGGAGCTGDPLLITRTYSITDGAGNSGTCTQVFTIIDTTNPSTANCPQDTSIDCNAAVMLVPPVFTDNCGGGVTVTMRDDSTGFDGSCTANVVGVIARTFFGEDACGNIDSTCVVLISIIDTTAPTFTVPLDTIIQCTEDSLASTTGDVTDAMDSCDGVTVDFSDVVVAGVCPATDTIYRTWTASDNCGNAMTGLQTITRIDTVAPTFTVPLDTMIDCSGDSTPFVTGQVLDAADNCSSFIVDFMDLVVPNGCPESDTIFRTWIVTDACGNVATGIQQILRLDTVPPSFTLPPDVTLECDADNSPANAGMPTGLTDNCSPATIVFVDNVQSGPCEGQDTIFRTWVASDLCANSSAQVQTILLVDTTPPMISCPADITIDCDASTAPGVTGTATATDNCAATGNIIITFSDTAPAGNCSADGAIQRTWTATDPCGNVAMCIQLINLQDTIAPMLVQGTCPADTSIDCTASSAGLGTPQYLDNCAMMVTITSRDDSTGFDGSCSAQVLGTISRIFFAEDECGNIDSSCVQTILVQDTVAPTFTVPMDVTIECNSDSLPAITGEILDTLDNCSSITVDFMDVVMMNGCPSIDTIFRTWIATDACGNSSTGLQTILRTDSEAPTFTVPPDTAIDCSINPIPANTGEVTDTLDNCSSITLTFNDVISGGICPVVSTISRAWTATDECGNSFAGTQIITLIDTIAPTFTAPPDTVINCDASIDPMDTGEVLDTLDNCSGISIGFADNAVPGICPAVDIVVRTWTATDDCGNSMMLTQRITRIDTVAPVLLTCPADTTFDCATPTDTLGLPTYSDNCLAVEITFRDDSIGFMPPSNLGMILRTFFGTDACGNVDSTCIQTIVVQDTTPPIVTFCPPDTSVECPVQGDTSITGVPLYMDNCNAVEDLVLTFTDDSTGFVMACPQGTITRTFYIEDLEGNVDSSCIQVIMILDTIAPFFDAPADITVDCDADLFDLSVLGNVTNVTDCNAIADTTFTDEMTSTACDGTGTIERSWVVRDVCDNPRTMVQVITTVDNDEPVISIPANITVSCESALDTSITGGNVSAVDNCSSIFTFGFTDDVAGLGCNGTGNLVRIWTAEDECGNVVSAQQLITIQDNTPPTAICMDITIDFEQGFEQIIDPVDVDGGSFDNCGPVTLSLSQNTFTCLDFGDQTTQVIQLIVTDDCGNSASCDVNVTGTGGAGLELICPDNIVRDLPSGQCSAIVHYEVEVAPLCGDLGSVTIEQVDNSGLTSGDFFPIGVTIQQYIAYTPFSDTVSCSFTITIVEGPEDPYLTCNDTVNISVDQNCDALINPDIILEGGIYGCFDDFTITVEAFGSSGGEIIVSNPDLGVYYNVTITNEEGLSCWGTVVFEDKLPPMITCLDATLECGDDTDPVFIDPIMGTATTPASPGSAIGPGGGVVTTQDLVVNAPANAKVTDVNITIDLDHTFSSDLDVFLIGPDGVTTVELATDVCGGTNDWANVTFDDEAATAVGAACGGGPALTGSVQPEGLLSDFDGADASGTWTLMITDDAGGDGGTLNYVSIDVAYFVQLPYAPVATDGCGEVTLTYEETESGDECTAEIIERLWTATDASGNTATCLQTITILPLTLDGLEFPPLHEGECDESNLPANTGWPTLDGVEIVSSFCNIFVGWTDVVIPGCGSGTKIQRDWTVLDWCTQEIVFGTQLIKLTDNEAPILDCPDDITISADPWFCLGLVNIDEPDVFDACGTATTMTPSASSGDLVPFGSFWRIENLDLGTHTITWTVEDACGNSSTCSYDITVIDDIPPVPLCDEHTIVSLTEDIDLEQGLTKIPAETFDDGSYDNCGGVTFQARRMTSCINFDWIGPPPTYGEYPNSDGIVTSLDRGQVPASLVPFACCDVGAGPIMVELRVTDEFGNTNTCMVEVEVQDKISPYLECPPNVIVSCDFWFDAQETGGFVPQDQDVLTPVFGRVLDANENDPSDRQPIIIDDPGNDEQSQPYQWGIDGWADDNCDVNITVRVRLFDDCSGDDLPGAPPSPYTVRLVERTFRAQDNEGNSRTCVQRIWVVDFDPFYISDQTCVNSDPNDGVRWPCDETYTTCPDEIPVNYPTIYDDNCSLIAVTYEDATFEFVDGACLKILRTWTIIDWCQYDPQTGAGIWDHVQVIKVQDGQAPAFDDCPTSPVVLCVADENVYLPNNNQVFLGEENPNSSSCSAHVDIDHVVTETCSDYVLYDVKLFLNDGPDYIQVVSQQQADVDSNNQATITFRSEFASLPSNHPIRRYGVPYNDAVCSNWPLAGGTKDYHKLLWTVEDGCGNQSTCQYLFRLEDCKQPSPVCVGLSSVVMPTSGAVTIWASDFNASSFDDCTPAEDLLFSFSGDTYQPSMEFDCEALVENGSPSFLVEIWVADAGNDQNCNGFIQPLGIEWSERNKDFCTTFIVIDDNEGVCPGDAPIGGEIYTEESEFVKDVIVHLTDGSGVVVQEYTTTETGLYHFINPLIYQGHQIQPARNDDHANGVSTLDLVRIQQHLLGLQPFESPYKLIAADANNSQSVSAIDLVEIRKLILGVHLEYPSNTSWRFVNKDFVFADVHNPWPFEESIALTSGMTMHEDFIGIKVGDVNGTVAANAQNIEIRNSGSLVLETKERSVKTGDQVSVPVSASNFDQILGYQFTLRTSGLEYAGVDKGALDMTDQNIGLHKGALTTSWHTAVALSSDEVLFTLHFVATQDGQLSEMLNIGSTLTEAEAYTAASIGTDSQIDVSLKFESDDPAEIADLEYALMQNEPNPFSDKTVIGFTLPREMEATIHLFDATGRVLRIIEGTYAQGYNEVSISSDEKLNGLLYYRLNAGDFTATKKMMNIK